MKRSFFQIIPYIIILFFINILILFSFVNKEKEQHIDFIYKPEPIHPAVNFSLIDCLNESNKKNIEISGIALHKTQDTTMLQLLLKIRKDHQNIDLKLKYLAKKNLIIIPEPIYVLNMNTDSLKGKNACLYLSNLLKKEIKTQRVLLDEISNTFQNPQFTTFASQSKKILESNKDSLKILLNI